MSGVGHNQTGRHVERCGLACTVRSEQSHNLALAHVYGHVVHHGAFAVTFHQSLCAKRHALPSVFRRGGCRHCLVIVVRCFAHFFLSLLALTLSVCAKVHLYYNVCKVSVFLLFGKNNALQFRFFILLLHAVCSLLASFLPALEGACVRRKQDGNVVVKQDGLCRLFFTR